MTNVDALKELYKALGGNAATVADITLTSDMIVEISKIASSTLELPAVSSTDNGSILKVVDGKWAKGAETKELPNPATATAGDVLTVVDGAWAAAALPD